MSTFIEAVIAPAVDEAARADPGDEGEHARGDRRLRRADEPAASSCARFSARCSSQERDVVVEARQPWTPASLPDGLRVVTQAAADGRRVGGAALRVARLRAREVEHRDLHRRAADAGDRRRADEPRRRGQRRGDEGRRRRAAALAGSVAASDAFFPFRDGLDAVARPARPRSCSRAARARCRGHRRRRRARPRDGVHGDPAFPALAPYNRRVLALSAGKTLGVYGDRRRARCNVAAHGAVRSRVALRRVFAASNAPTDVRGHDISPDGRRFIGLVNALGAAAPSRQLHVVLNWFDDLKARAAAK